MKDKDLALVICLKKSFIINKLHNIKLKTS